METDYNTPAASVYLSQSLNASYGPQLVPVPLGQPSISPPSKTKTSDPTGEGYYVIAVFLVYGMSIVLLIASHIRRKHSKLAIDKEICKYLQEFQIVKETSNRDSYRNLKRSIIAKLLREKHGARKGVANLALPMAAVALPSDPPSEPDNEEDDDDDDDAEAAADASEDRSRIYADFDSWVEEEELGFHGHQTTGSCSNEANGYHSNQISDLKESSAIVRIATGRNVYHGNHESPAVNKGKQAELVSCSAFEGNGYHVIRIPEVSDCDPEAVGRCVDDANGYHGNHDIMASQLRRHDEGGNGGRTQLKIETEMSGLLSSAAEYSEALRRPPVNVGLTLGSRDPRWILLPLLLENRLRTERQDYADRIQDAETEEKMKDAQAEEPVKCRDGDSPVVECSTGRADDVDSYTYVL